MIDLEALRKDLRPGWEIAGVESENHHARLHFLIPPWSYVELWSVSIDGYGRHSFRTWELAANYVEDAARHGSIALDTKWQVDSYLHIDSEIYVGRGHEGWHMETKADFPRAALKILWKLENTNFPDLETAQLKTEEFYEKFGFALLAWRFL